MIFTSRKKIGFMVCMLLLGGILLAGCGKKAEDTPAADGESQTAEGLVIPVADITEEARFYKLTVDKVEMEVLAVKASDGTIRTAFNTCQICYQSPAGYYKQQEDYLICQNCRNAFQIDEVEVIRGGCNPVPIGTDEKTTDDENITITAEVMRQYIELFK